MSKQPSHQGADSDRGHIRLVDDIRRSLPAAPTTTHTPAKEKKTKTPSEGKGKGKGKEKTVKLKGPKQLVSRLESMQATLAGLKGRLDILNGDQTGQAAATARLARRLDTLNDDIRTRIAWQDAIQGQLDALGSSIADSGQESDPGDALNEITRGLELVTERVAKAESRLAMLADEADARLDLASNLGDIEGRIAATTALMEAQRGQMARLEQSLRAPPPSDEHQAALEARIDGLREVMDGEVEALTANLEQTREHIQKRRETEKCWTDSRLRRLRRDQSIGAGLVGLVLFALATLGWWQQGRLQSVTDLRLTALEQQAPTSMVTQTPVSTEPTIAPAAEPDALPAGLETTLEGIADRLEQLQSADLPGPYTRDLLDRLGRVESGILELTRGLAEDGGRTEALSQRLAELVSAREDLDRRVDAIERANAGADSGMARMNARGDRLTRPGEAPDSQDDTGDAMVVDRSGAFGVQLVVYRGTERIAPFVASHGIGERARSMEIRVDGRPAHAVLLGPYPNESEAMSALADLDPRLKALKPWIRPLSPGTRLMTVH